MFSLTSLLQRGIKYLSTTYQQSLCEKYEKKTVLITHNYFHAQNPIPQSSSIRKDHLSRKKQKYYHKINNK